MNPINRAARTTLGLILSCAASVAGAIGLYYYVLPWVGHLPWHETALVVRQFVRGIAPFLIVIILGLLIAQRWERK